ncbi:MAG: hypothetical protein Q8O95_05295, partial [bacterium]|nr:hypothetical protein [bacterium]
LKEAGFNGYHLAEIVRNAGWEEKLKYFEDDQKLNKLKEAGFNGYHLAEIVRNAGWEEKMELLEKVDLPQFLSDNGLTHDQLSKRLMKKDGLAWLNEVVRAA